MEDLKHLHRLFDAKKVSHQSIHNDLILSQVQELEAKEQIRENYDDHEKFSLMYCESLIQATHISIRPALPSEGIDLHFILSLIEQHLIKTAMEMTQGNKKRAADLLSLNRTTLIEKIKKYQLAEPACGQNLPPS